MCMCMCVSMRLRVHVCIPAFLLLNLCACLVCASTLNPAPGIHDEKTRGNGRCAWIYRCCVLSPPLLLLDRLRHAWIYRCCVLSPPLLLLDRLRHAWIYASSSSSIGFVISRLEITDARHGGRLVLVFDKHLIWSNNNTRCARWNKFVGCWSALALAACCLRPAAHILHLRLVCVCVCVCISGARAGSLIE